MKKHPDGCRCFTCDLDRHDVLGVAEDVAERNGVELELLGAGGRAPSPSVAVARRELARELVYPTRRGRAPWSVNATARLLRVDTGTVRYWLREGQDAA